MRNHFREEKKKRSFFNFLSISSLSLALYFAGGGDYS
jgi:hypothetical protein